MPVSTEAAEIINRKKAQYCRFADTSQWHLFDRIMLPDVTLKFVHHDGSVVNQHGRDYIFSSREDWTEWFTKAFESIQTIHLIGPGELTQTAPDEVKAVFGVVYHVGSYGADGGFQGTGGGHYHEKWKQKDGDWFMQDVHMQHTYWKLMTLSS